MLVAANTIILVFILLELSFLHTLRLPPNNFVIDAIYAENYAAADRALASTELPDDLIATLFFVNDAMRQQFFQQAKMRTKICAEYI